MLLIVVIMLAICCALLAQVATVSMGQARKAVAVERELQERWAVVSLRRCLLVSSAGLLQQSNLDESERGEEVDAIAEFQPLSGTVVLSHRTYQFVIDDESRKLPLCALAMSRPDDAATAANVLLQKTGLSVDRRKVSALQSGQRWDLVVGQRLSARAVLDAGQHVTLWGDGRLNLRTANTDVVRQTWRAVFGTFPPSEIIDKSLLAELPWPRIRDGLALRQEQLAELDRYFSAQSTCYSVMLRSKTAQGERSWLFVADRGTQHFGYEL